VHSFLSFNPTVHHVLIVHMIVFITLCQKEALSNVLLGTYLKK